ncbi:unnamed protein product, partial [Rotaria sp. Silwood2]
TTTTKSTTINAASTDTKNLPNNICSVSSLKSSTIRVIK